MKKIVKNLMVLVILCLMFASLALVTSAELSNDVITTFVNENEATPAAIPVNAIQVSGTILWEDENGNTHPARNMEVSIFDNGFLSVITTTNSSGYYSASITSPFGGNSFYIVVETSGLNVTVCDNYHNVYSITSSTYSNAQIGESVPLSCTFDNETDEGKAASIHQALEMANRFMYSINGSYMSDINVNMGYNTTCYDFYTSEIYISMDHTFNWDVIQHEYGHYVADTFSISNNTGGTHICNYNLSDFYEDKSIGKHLAWEEGFATYFAIIAQIETQSSSLNIPGVGDEIYNVDGFSTIDLDTGYYSLNNSNICLGEANEITVAGILYNLSDNESISSIDKVNITVEEIWELLKETECTTLSNFIDNINNYYSTEFVLKLGETLSYFRVAACLNSPTNLSSSTPTFSWVNQGGSTLHPNDSFDLVFYDSSYNFILGVYNINASNNAGETSTTSVTLSAEQWNTIKSYAQNEMVYCSVKTSQHDTPTSGPYYSAPIIITL